MSVAETKATVLVLVILCCAVFYGLGWTHGSSGNSEA